MPSTSIFKLLYDTIIQTVEINEDIHLHLYLQPLSVCVSLLTDKSPCLSVCVSLSVCQFVDGHVRVSVSITNPTLQNVLKSALAAQ